MSDIFDHMSEEEIFNTITIRENLYMKNGENLTNLIFDNDFQIDIGKYPPSRKDTLHMHYILLHLIAIRYSPKYLINAHKLLAKNHLLMLHPLRIKYIYPILNIIGYTRPDIVNYIMEKMNELYMEFELPTKEQIYIANIDMNTYYENFQRYIIEKFYQLQSQISTQILEQDNMESNLYMLAEIASNMERL